MLTNDGELDGIRILAESTVQSLSQPRERSDEVDAVLNAPQRIGIGALRYGGPPQGEPVVGSNPRTLYHPGAGGSIGFADRDERLAAAICHNRMFSRGAMKAEDHPFEPLGDAIRQVAGERKAARIG
jgi:CubicO group peptidase (beta-lactamase class C family)